MTTLKITVALIIFGLCLVQNCIRQEEFLPPYVPEDQCVTPIKELSLSVASGGISTTLDGFYFAVATGKTHLFNNKGELLWSKRGMGSRYALLLSNGEGLIASIYDSNETWKSGVAKLDIEGNILWERQTGLIGVDGLAVTPDGSYIAVGASDEEKNGHLMLFDGDGTKLWDHQIDGRIETVAVSKTGYVVAGPRDWYIYVYDLNGELIFTYYAGSFIDTQDTAIAPDESYFLFGSKNTYLNCYTLEGDLLWQEEVGSLCNIRISADGEYIVVATAESTLFLFDKNGTKLWSKKVTDAFFIEEVAISAHAEYIAINAKEKNFLSQLYITVYSRQGELLWRYEGSQPFKAIAISDDGHYIAAGNSNALVFFDNFAAIEEYKSSECVQSHKDEQFKVCIC